MNDAASSGPTADGGGPQRNWSSEAPTQDAGVRSRGVGGVGGGMPRPGETVGPYTLLELIGEGGFGTVWLAERREPMVQRVAIKIIKPGMDSKAVVARFDQERQALAVMDHPNVAKVFDGGVTERGLPYFVMEHVAGEPLTNFCDKHRLTIRQRLELFTSVCDAVQHAHMKGIIHRDIKPSNVLAEMVDGKPLVKVIDFGIAKAMDTSEVQNSVFSMEGQLIGTPEYMSPEQAGGQADIDTRTDVYSLGVMLYELLVGRLPFDPATLRQRGMDEIRRIIREDDPPRPSTRLSTIGAEGSTIALSRHHHSPATLIRELRRELEWIPLKAMRKERERRYSSAESFAADVRRYLCERPIDAAPESRRYRLRKFVVRHRIPVTAAGLIVASLGIGLGTSLFQRNQALEQRLLAIRNETHAKRHARFLAETLSWNSPVADNPITVGRNITLRETLERGMLFAKQDATMEDTLRREVMLALANGFRVIGLRKPEESARREALSRIDRASEPVEFAKVSTSLASALIAQDKVEEALVHLDRSIETLEGVGVAARSMLADVLDIKCVAINQAAILDIDTGDDHSFDLEFRAARLRADDCAALLPPNSPAVARFRRSLAAPPTTDSYCELLAASLDMASELKPPNSGFRSRVLAKLASAYERKDDDEMAVATCDKRIELCLKEFGDADARTASAFLQAGVMARRREDWSAAAEQLGRGLQIQKRLGGGTAAFDGPHASYFVDSLLALGRAGEALPIAKEKYDAAVESHGPEHRYAKSGLSQLLDCMIDLEMWNDALPAAERLVELNVRKEVEGLLPISLARLALVASRCGIWETAMNAADDALLLLSDEERPTARTVEAMQFIESALECGPSTDRSRLLRLDVTLLKSDE
ncbi:MAG: serine/threonine-protein kinase [Phycisphaerales bacterium]|nr:serine/threonine protein kinase [Planctomycetota bacterium]